MLFLQSRLCSVCPSTLVCVQDERIPLLWGVPAVTASISWHAWGTACISVWSLFRKTFQLWPLEPSWTFFSAWRWPWTTRQRLSLWQVKWKIHPWLCELNQTQGVRMQPQGFSLYWGYPPPISTGGLRGRSGKVCSFMALNETCTGPFLLVWGLSKKVLLPRSGALCAQRRQGCRHCAVAMSRGWGYAQWAKKSRSAFPLRAPHVWKPGSMGCFTGSLPPEEHI